MIDPGPARRVLKHLRETPQFVVARKISKSLHPSAHAMKIALEVIEALVEAGYAIEPIEDDDE